jgi:hypothetical protein
MWAAGTAAGGAVVVWWRIVGSGYTWLVAACVVMLALGAAGLDGGGTAVLGAVTAAAAVVLARRPRAAAVALAGGGLLLMVGRWSLGTASGALLLGAITSELLLGHWYLVDPRLPRWALSSLAGGAALAVLVEVALVGGYREVGANPLGLILAVTTALLMVGVVLALRRRGYRPVMAATGLSYLALLTGLGAAGVVRLVPG